MKTGKLIAIEGIDGSGKGTQTELLVHALQASSLPAEVFRFPQYETSFFGKEVGKYLHGDYGQLADVPPRFSALLYALDRFEARNMIVSALEQGKIVLCDRYTPSNMAHQSARASADEQLNMAEWIRYVEQEVLCLPKPDLVLFLESTVKTSQTLVPTRSTARCCCSSSSESAHERASYPSALGSRARRPAHRRAPPCSWICWRPSARPASSARETSSTF